VAVKKQKQAKKKSRISFATKLMVVVNLIFICLLLASYLSLYVSPEKFWPLAFAGLIYPLILVSNLFFVLFWIVFLKRYFLLSLITILLGYNQIKTCVRFFGPEHTLSFGHSIKIMTYNVRLFDLYNWRNETSKATRASIFELIQEESPEILCLQEYYSGAGKQADFADTICKQTGYKYRDIRLINKDGKGLPYGLALFSKFPIIQSGILEFSNSKVNFCQWCNVKIGNDTVRIMNMHLESVKFGKEDYNFVSEITTTPASNNKLKKGSSAIIDKMHFSYIKRTAQIATITDFIDKCPFALILTGDFNDTPISYCYRQVSNKLTDSFVESGTGFGQSYVQKLLMLRIDYIFHSSALKSVEYRTIEKDYSDHYPVVTRLQLPEQ
jgi:endonuclease/exonuclease/phosphatase family metal-dependent hydrolase